MACSVKASGKIALNFHFPDWQREIATTGEV